MALWTNFFRLFSTPPIDDQDEDDMGATDDEDSSPSLDSDALDEDNQQNMLNFNVDGMEYDTDNEAASLASDFTDSLTELRFGDNYDSENSGDLSSDEDLLNMIEWANNELEGKSDDEFIYTLGYDWGVILDWVSSSICRVE